MRRSGIIDRNPRTPRPLDRNYIREKTLEGQQTTAAKGNHGGRPKVIDDDMLTFAVALKNEGVPVPDIAKKLTIKTGKNAGRHPSVASLSLGRVSKVPPGLRRPARTLAALSESPKYVQYEGDPPPCDCTHRTPQAPPSGRTALLSIHALALAEAEEAASPDDAQVIGPRRPVGEKLILGIAPQRIETAD
ncbi:hypothetical protein ACFYT4_27765 [Streptomyces sp. NPDC004609]|uniref:hypothetical protein n=1 Tax=Streptomyces sp. NPDC004609 TaxID=3364704 RepID=UPI0036ACDFC5